MNLVDLIKDQLTGEVTNKLGSLLGVGESQTTSALGAAVPGLLAALSGVAQGGGGDKIASTLNKLDLGSLGKLTGMLTGDPDAAVQQGNNLLGSLFGGSTLSALTGALARFTGLDSVIANKLLAYISPLVLGAIAKQFHGKPVSAQGLKSLFDEQKSNIAQALPSGLSLADIPGIPDVRAAATNMAAGAHRAAGAARDTGSSFVKTLLPIAALALLGFLAWQYFRGEADRDRVKEVAETAVQHTVQRPVTDPAAAVPDVTQVSDKLTNVYTTATDTLNKITDAASAEAALPKLTDLSTQLEGLSKLQAQLPAAARSTIAKMATDHIGPLTQLIEKILAIPGVGEKLEPVLHGLLTKLESLEG